MFSFLRKNDCVNKQYIANLLLLVKREILHIDLALAFDDDRKSPDVETIGEDGDLCNERAQLSATLLHAGKQALTKTGENNGTLKFMT